jgi:hypothetical protein
MIRCSYSKSIQDVSNVACKDMDKVNPDWNAEIGSGSINFKAIFAKS